MFFVHSVAGWSWQTARDDKEGLTATSKKVHGMLDELVASGIPSDRIVLGGFSQGGT